MFTLYYRVYVCMNAWAFSLLNKRERERKREALRRPHLEASSATHRSASTEFAGTKTHDRKTQTRFKRRIARRNAVQKGEGRRIDWIHNIIQKKAPQVGDHQRRRQGLNQPNWFYFRGQPQKTLVEEGRTNAFLQREAKKLALWCDCQSFHPLSVVL